LHIAPFHTISSSDSNMKISLLGYQPIAEGTREPTVKSLYWEKTLI
jgi:hypothetical protein